MDVAQAAESVLASLNNPSQTAEFDLWKDIVAESQEILEQLQDTFLEDVELQISQAAVGHESWIKAQVLKFQYSTVNPQVIQLINFAPAYTTVNESLRIVTRCSVVTDYNKIVRIKVAKGLTGALSQLSNPEYSSLYGYLTKIDFAGVAFNLINAVSDKIYIKADVYYDGQVSAFIQTAVEGAIDNYFANLPFNGVLKITSLVDAIQAVEGVNDVDLKIVKVRQDTVLLASATTIYDITSSGPADSIQYLTYAGYCVTETTAGNTISDTITYIAE